MRKWVNFETMFRSLADELSDFLHNENIKAERSGCFDGYHFEIFANKEEVDKIENWLMKNTITEQR